MKHEAFNTIKSQLNGIKARYFLSVFLLLVTVCAAILLASHQKPKTAVPTLAVASRVKTPIIIPAIDSHLTAKNIVASNALPSKIITVQKKDNLQKIFKRLGFNPKDASKILASKPAQSLRGLRRGTKLNFYLNSKDKSLQQLVYNINDTTTLTITHINSGFQSKLVHVEPALRLQYVSAKINGSIYTAGKRAGVPAKIMRQFASVFNSKTNFAKGIRVGDRFSLYYRGYYIKDKKIRDGDIAIAELIHKNKAYRVIGFKEPTGITKFYTPQGYSLVSPFLRYPLKFKSIGDRFSMARYEPFLHVVRPHWGVDLRAPMGTPVKAASDGRVMASKEHGFGNVIVVQHGIYSTLYAHLSRFAAGIHTGSYVRQGQLIAFVGQTGFATGPHLHYEFHIGNQRFDPLSVKLPAGEMIAQCYRGQFFSFARTMVAKLDMQKSVKVALQETDSNEL